MEPVIIFYIVIVIVAVAIAIMMIIAILKIPQIAKYEKAQLKLLASIAEQNNVDMEFVMQVLIESDSNFENDPHFQSTEETPEDNNQ